MPAYVIANAEVFDPTVFAEYVKAAPAVITSQGGIYLARGGAIDVLEGEWSPTRLTILKFESMAQAKAWHDSPEYRALREIRNRAAKSKFVIVDGLQAAR